MQFWKDYFCKPCSAAVTSPQEDMDYRMGNCIGVARSQAAVHTDEVSPVKEKCNGAENGSVRTDSATAEPQVSDEEDKQRRQEEEDKEELEFPHDLLPSIDLSTELNLTWGSSLGSGQVGSGGMKNETTANPLLAGLQHYMEASPPVVGLMKSYDADQLSTASPSEHQAQSSTGQENVSSLKPLAEMDYELEEAFKECENQMAVLGMSSHADTWSAGDLDRSFSVALPDKKDSGSSSQSDRSDVVHKNEASAGEVEVFSFRDYILGNKKSNTGAVRTDLGNSIMENHSDEASQLSDPEKQTKSEIETKIDTAEYIPEQETIESMWTGTHTGSEIEAAKQTLIQDQLTQDICSLKYSMEAESTEGLKGSDRVYIAQEATWSAKDTQIIQKTNADVKIETHGQLMSDLTTLTDKHTGEMLLNLEPKPNIQKQVESGTQKPISGQKETTLKVQSSPNNQRTKLGLSCEDKQPICFPSPEPDTHQAHLSQSGAPPAPILHSPQGGLEQHDDQNWTDGHCRSISDQETIHHNHCSIVEVKHEKNVSVASAVVIDFGHVASEREPTGSRDLQTCLLEQGNGPPIGGGAGVHTPLWGNSHSLSRTGAGEEEEEDESALEWISAADSFLQTTPTRQECEGEERGDAYQSAAIIVQAAERDTSDLDSDLLQSGTQEQKCTIFPKINSSPVQRLEEKEEVAKKSCDSRMPHNSSESEEKGGGLPIVLSPAGDEDTSSVGTEDKALVTISSPDVPETCDWKEESSQSTERMGEGEKEGSDEEGKEQSKGGAQNAAHAGSLSLTEADSSHSITASLTATHDESDLTPSVTADTALSALTIKRTNDCDSINPPPPRFLLNNTKTAEEQKEAEAYLNQSPSGSDSLLPPAVFSERDVLAAQASDQQVQSSSQTGITNSDADIKTDTHQQNQAVSTASEDVSLKLSMKNMNEIALKTETECSFGGQKDTALKCQMTKCASLPPLMVFEKLRHPVKESSFNFEGFLNSSKPPPIANLQKTEVEISQGANNKPIASEEKNEKQEDKKKQVEMTCQERKSSRDGYTTQDINDFQENVSVIIGSSEESGEVTDDVIKNRPVISVSQSAAGETTSVLSAKAVSNETLKDVKEKQKIKESFSVSQISPNDENESVSTEKQSVIPQHVSLQENTSQKDSPGVNCVGAEIVVGVEQLATKEPNGKSDESIRCVSAETVQKTCPDNSEIRINDNLGSEQYTCEDKPQVKSTSMSSDTDTTGPCVINTTCLSQPDMKSNTEQPNTTSEMQILPKADEYPDKLFCETESQLNDGGMTSAAADADYKPVPSPTVADTSVPVQRDLSLNSTQSTNSDARDVPVIVLKTPGPMLSHCEDIYDRDIALGGAGEHCSVDCVCDSHTEAVKDFKEERDDVNEKFFEEKNADDYTVGVSTQEVATSSGSLLLTADSPKQACGSLLASESPETDKNAKRNEGETDIGIKGKREYSNSENVPRNIKMEVGTAVQDDEQNSQSLLHSSHICSDENVSFSISKITEPKPLPSDLSSGHVSSKSVAKELQSITNMQNVSVSLETTCTDESLNSQSPVTSPNDGIKTESLETSKEPAHHVSLDANEGFMPVMGGEPNNECVNEPQGQISSAKNASEEEGNKQNQRSQTALKEQAKNTCQNDLDSAHTCQEKDETTVKPERNVDETELINVDVLRTSGEKNDLNEENNFTPVSDPALTSKGRKEEDSGIHPDLSQSDLLFSQSQELHQQQVFMSTPPEAISDVDENMDKSFENAETNNYADAEASENQEKVIVCCTTEAQSSLNGTSESSTLQEGNKRRLIVDITGLQNNQQSIQTTDLSSENSPYPVCGESTSRENSNQTQKVVKEESEVSLLLATEKQDTQTKESAVLASQESKSNCSECVNSETIADKHENLWNKIPDAKKESECPVDQSSGPSISHQEAGEKTDGRCFSSVPNGDNEIRLDSQSDVAQMSILETSAFQHKDSGSQPTDMQLSITTTYISATVLPEKIKDDKQTTDQDSRDTENLGLCRSVDPTESLNCNSEVLKTTQPNTYFSEQFSDCTQKTEDQDTQCTAQHLDIENIISAVKAEDTVLKKNQQGEEMIKAEINVHTDTEVNLKSPESVVEGSKDDEHQRMLSAEKQAIAKDETQIEMKQAAVNVTSLCPKISVSLFTDTQDSLQLPLMVNQQSSQPATESFVQSFQETERVEIGSDQNPDTANSSTEDIGSFPIKNTLQKDDIEVKEKGNSVSESEDGLLGSGQEKAQLSQVIKSLDSQVTSVISVPESSGTINDSESSDWLRALKESAAMCQITAEHRDDTCGSAENRPLEFLSSHHSEPEFKTPTEEGFPPAPESFPLEIEDSFPPAPKSFLPAIEENFPPVPESFPPEIEENFPPAPESFPPEIEESFPPAPESFPPEIEENFPPAPENFPPEIEENFPPAPESFPPEIEENFPPAPESFFPEDEETLSPDTKESLLPVTEQTEEPPDCRSPITEAVERSEPILCSPSPPPQHVVAAALPAHLLYNTVEFPTPPPTPPDRALPGPQIFPSTSAPPDLPESSPVAPLPHPIQQLQQCEPSARSSDSDGAFETPESTTPVKSAASPVPPSEPPSTSSEPLPSQEHTTSTADITASEVQNTESSPPPPSRSPSTVFDEDKPIAASGAYNLEYLVTNDPFQESNSGQSSQQGRTPLTRSLSLQSGELESPGDKSSVGTSDQPSHPRTQSFSIETESAPGSLRRVKKPRPGSIKKKPLSRQNSNPEGSSPKPAFSSSTPEEKKRGKPRAESPLQTQERLSASPSPSPSPASTLKKNRIKSRVETPPPLAEEITPAPTSVHLQAEAVDPISETPAVPDEDSPIPPSASYKWDPDNFENIDPFRTGGSKIANSPELSRKADFTSVSDPNTNTSVAVEKHHSPSPAKEESLNAEEQPVVKRQPVRLEFDYSEDSGEAPRTTPPPKKLGKKPGAKMPIRKPKPVIRKPPPPQMEQLDNASPVPPLSNDNDDIAIPKASYNFDPSKWDDPNFNPFSSSSGVPNSPGLSKGGYNFDPDSFDESADPFQPSSKMGNLPPKAASFDVSTNDSENDNIVELEDHNQNKPAKNKKKPLKSEPNNFSSLCCFFNTFRVKKSPKRSPISEQNAQCCPVCSPLSPSTSHTHHHLQEHTPDTNPDSSQDLATDEEKLASSTNQKWATRHDVEVELTNNQDFPQPSDFTTFVNENSLSTQNDVTDYEIEYMEKIGSSAPSLSSKKPSLYLKLDSVTDSPKKSSNMQDSEPNSPCTGSFEEMEAQISQGKSPVLPPRSAREPTAPEKSRKRESQSQSQTQSIERDGASPIHGPMDPSDLPLLDRLSDSATPLSYLEPDLAETNPTAFAQKLQSRLRKPSQRRWYLNGSHMAKQREMASPGDSGVSRGSLYSRAGYGEGESPHLPRDMDHSLGIAREEVVVKEKEAMEWKRKYEESRREVEEMRRIVMEYEKTIAEMIEKSCVPLDPKTEGEQREKNLSHHTIQQLILERDQALADLNSVEKSLADLFRRYEKMKDVLEGFRKNEDVLKKCAQEYLSRVRKEEQRYQALKFHAEEKLDKANSEIAQVRVKAKQEQAAYQASLRKEQMKVDSLERTLEQKNKEIEELTKICDELIAKMGKS
ncbi:uncharacterized protein tacc2 isoform X6 [Misgurnus anguillicaudatus]|uniref:uncharacterized protein tacc2 isoform X6 n=1 Tax=Misgurnus anguillicaudatus TaxID=75329 RepID=UPI003CCF686C